MHSAVMMRLLQSLILIENARLLIVDGCAVKVKTYSFCQNVKRPNVSRSAWRSNTSRHNSSCIQNIITVYTGIIGQRIKMKQQTQEML